MRASKPQLSESLLAFAHPLLQLLPEGAGPAAITPLARIAALVWNSVALELLGHDSPYLEQARAIVRSNTKGLERDLALGLLADMEARKRREVLPDLRLIGEVELYTGKRGETRMRIDRNEAGPSAGPLS